MKNLITIKHLFFAALFLTTLYSCKKEDDNNDDKFLTEGGVIILNEGQFQAGNGSVSFFNPNNSELINDLFNQQNNRPLGDVVQSVHIEGNKAYIVVNNSSKIEIVDIADFKSLGTISGFTSPRYILPVSSSKAYVTDLFSGTISIVNLNNNTISGTISSTGWTEELVLVNGKVFVTNKESDYVYVINPNNDTKEDSITVAGGPNSLKVDRNGKIWVLCGGWTTYDANWTPINTVAGGIARINPSNLSVELNISLSNATDTPNKLRINGAKDKLYFLNNGVYAMDISASSFPSNAFVAQGTSSFYSLGVHPTSGDVYVGDAIDFVQRGLVYRYSSNGTLIEEFLVGINPTDFVFN